MDLDDTLEQTQWDTFWLPADATAVDRDDVLYLRAPRDDGYLNTVLRVRADEAALPALVREVDEAHGAVRSRWMLAGRSRHPALPSLLTAAGYTITHEHHGYAVDVHTYVPRPTPGLVAHAVESLDDLRDVLSVTDRAFDRAHHGDDATLRAELDACTREGARVRRFVVRDAATGAPLAAGGMNVYGALRFGFLWAGGTEPEARRRGAYTALVGARVHDARRLGLTHVGLYARVDTSAPIVAAQGFTRGGPMTYWERPARVTTIA